MGTTLSSIINILYLYIVFSAKFVFNLSSTMALKDNIAICLLQLLIALNDSLDCHIVIFFCRIYRLY